MGALDDLGLAVPLVAAPMAGGAGTPALVRAAARAGALGFVAAGYRSAEALAAQLDEVRDDVAVLGVNVFAPNPARVDPEAYRRYADVLRAEAERFDVELPREPVEDDDDWPAKIDLLRTDPVPVVSFTFGIPDAHVIAVLRRAGSTLVQTVTSADEARLATDAGVDALVVQASAAGAHSGTLTPERIPDQVPLGQLLAEVRAATPLPLIAAGGLGTAADVGAAIGAGASAAMVGTVLLRTDESGASAVHRAALADPARSETVVTRAFTGRPARALRNRFVDAYDPLAPTGYPAVHHLTTGLRRAAAAAGDPETVHLWAGTAWRHATAEPADLVLTRLASRL